MIWLMRGVFTQNPLILVLISALELKIGILVTRILPGACSLATWGSSAQAHYLQSFRRVLASKDSDALTPALQSWVELDLIRKGIRLAGRDRWYMLFVFVHNCNNLQSRSV